MNAVPEFVPMWFVRGFLRDVPGGGGLPVAGSSVVSWCRMETDRLALEHGFSAEEIEWCRRFYEFRGRLGEAWPK